jgi:hypothetical protein
MAQPNVFVSESVYCTYVEFVALHVCLFVAVSWVAVYVVRGEG